MWAYKPDGDLACPSCGLRVIGWESENGAAWQGKDGPCWLFVWEQGQKHPVAHAVRAEEILIHELSGKVLPAEFSLYAE